MNPYVILLVRWLVTTSSYSSNAPIGALVFLVFSAAVIDRYGPYGHEPSLVVLSVHLTIYVLSFFLSSFYLPIFFMNLSLCLILF